MKTKKILLIIIPVLILIIGIVLFLFNREDIEIKTISFAGCEVKYEYSRSNFTKPDGELSLNEYFPGYDNEFCEFNAKQDLCLCLCEKYEKTKDKKIADYLTLQIIERRLYETFELKKYNTKQFTIDSICKYKEIIFYPWFLD